MKLIVLTAALFAVPTLAHAASMECHLVLQDKTVIESMVSVEEKEAGSSLFLNGKQVAALGACKSWSHGNGKPGGKWRCTHGTAEDLFEVYPVIPESGPVNPYVYIVHWQGARVVGSYELTECE